MDAEPRPCGSASVFRGIGKGGRPNAGTAADDFFLLLPQTAPWAIMALDTFRKPAMLAPTT